jgi:hypothetical protein
LPDKPPNDTPIPGADTADQACSLVDPAAEATAAGDSVAKHGALGEARTGRLAALIYTGLSLLAAALFIVATTIVGDYPAVATYGGAAWVFVLMMIVLMPFVIPRIRKWRG